MAIQYQDALGRQNIASSPIAPQAFHVVVLIMQERLNHGSVNNAPQMFPEKVSCTQLPRLGSAKLPEPLHIYAIPPAYRIWLIFNEPHNVPAASFANRPLLISITLGAIEVPDYPDVSAEDRGFAVKSAG